MPLILFQMLRIANVLFYIFATVLVLVFKTNHICDMIKGKESDVANIDFEL